jgi:arginase family enzyme
VSARQRLESREDALDHLDQEVDAIYVDLDLMCSTDIAPAGSRPGGLTPAELRSAAACVARIPRFAMDLVEIDPTKDRGGNGLAAGSPVIIAWSALGSSRGKVSRSRAKSPFSICAIRV